MTLHTEIIRISRAAALALCTLLLAGCADTYDKSAMPKAAAYLQQATARCEGKWTAKELSGYSAWQACQLAAERGFAQAIALRRMDAFETYAAQMMALAADRDAQSVTDRQVRTRANEIQWKFLADCGCKPGWKPNPNYNHWAMIPFTSAQPPYMPTTP